MHGLRLHLVLGVMAEITVDRNTANKLGRDVFKRSFMVDTQKPNRNAEALGFRLAHLELLFASNWACMVVRYQSIQSYFGACMRRTASYWSAGAFQRIDTFSHFAFAVVLADVESGEGGIK